MFQELPPLKYYLKQLGSLMIKCHRLYQKLGLHFHLLRVLKMILGQGKDKQDG